MESVENMWLKLICKLNMLNFSNLFYKEIEKIFEIYKFVFSEKVSKFSTDPAFNDNVYLTFRNNQYGTVGMGYVGTVCHPAPYQYLRSNLCEYLNNDITAGQVRIK